MHGMTYVNLSAAGNIVVPAYLALLAKGYVVSCQRADHSEMWIAEGANGRFTADNPITLLGVVGIAETRGENWRASDSEIDAFLKKSAEPRRSE